MGAKDPAKTWRPSTASEFNPHKLPERYDFHKATSHLMLPIKIRNKFQIKLSEMNEQQIRAGMKELMEICHKKLSQAKVPFNEHKGNLVFTKQTMDEEKRELVQQAIFAKAMHEFADKYLISIKKQNKV